MACSSVLFRICHSFNIEIDLLTQTPKKIKLSRVRLFPDGVTEVDIPFSAFTEVTTSAAVSVNNNTGLIVMQNNINNTPSLTVDFYNAPATITLTKGSNLNMRYYVYNGISSATFYAYFFDLTYWTIELITPKGEKRKVALHPSLFEFSYD